MKTSELSLWDKIVLSIVEAAIFDNMALIAH